MTMAMASQRQRRPRSARERRLFPSFSRVSKSLQKKRDVFNAHGRHDTCHRRVLNVHGTQLAWVRSRPIFDKSASKRQISA